MVSIRSIAILISLTFLSVLRLSDANGESLPIVNWQTFVVADSITPTPVLQQTVEVTANYDDQEALINVTIPFQNGTCTNPVIEIYREAVDYNIGSEYLEFFYDAYNNESLIFRCGETPSESSDTCGAFVFCGEFEVPVGVYTMLELFIFQSTSVRDNCGDDADEEGPLRTLKARFTVSCQVEVECEEDEPSEEEEQSEDEQSSSESVDDAVRTVQRYDDHSPIYSRDIESNKEEVDNIPVRIDCNSYFNFLMMIVLCIGVCWIGQCALFCRYKKH